MPRMKRAGVGGVLDILFGTTRDSRLSPAQNRSARSQALLTAGLRLMSSKHPDIGSALAEAALVSRDTFDRSKAELLAQRMEAYSGVFDQLPPQQRAQVEGEYNQLRQYQALQHQEALKPTAVSRASY